MNKKIKLAILMLMNAYLFACGKEKALPEPQLTQMQAIAELAVLDSYYHNVAKYSEEEAQRFLWWTKDKEFWIEYSGIVTVGIDFNKVEMAVKGNKITISLPAAEIQSVSVDSSQLNAESFIVAKDSAKVTAEDERFAFAEAQKQLAAYAANDTALLAEANARTKNLLENYLHNLYAETGFEYTIEWKAISD